MISPTSKALKDELIDRCHRILKKNGFVFVEINPGAEMSVVIDTHEGELAVYLGHGRYVEEIVLCQTRGIWRMVKVRNKVLPILRKHMVLDDIAGV